MAGPMGGAGPEGNQESGHHGPPQGGRRWASSISARGMQLPNLRLIDRSVDLKITKDRKEGHFQEKLA
ncbi:hypothetical protein PBY51_012227 [Eleginops maclovinus]|uniref:Uncharacterized protein n=1 Tax=Eleginops maclovinus TaxID=56733 RepID=A0AAN8APQ6_ELEMC|nr:hypothetical protein PBY51_012227 [Eleginops maclovinus]